MIIKIAINKKAGLDPALIDSSLRFIGDHIPSIGGWATTLGMGSVIGSRLKSFGPMLMRKGNFLGRAFSRNAMSDAIVAAKHGSMGHGIQETKLLASLLGGHGATQAKTFALGQMNESMLATPFLRSMFNKERPNLLNVEGLKTALSQAKQTRENLIARQAELKRRVVTRAAHANKGLGEENAWQKAVALHQRVDSHTRPITDIAHNQLNAMEQLHNHLNRNNGYGYQMLEGAALKAEKSLNRPKLLNYSHWVYGPPKEGGTGLMKYPARAFDVALGHHKDVGMGKLEFLRKGHPGENAFIGEALANRDKAETGLVSHINSFAKQTNPKAPEIPHAAVEQAAGKPETYKKITEVTGIPLKLSERQQARTNRKLEKKIAPVVTPSPIEQKPLVAPSILGTVGQHLQSGLNTAGAALQNASSRFLKIFQ